MVFNGFSWPVTKGRVRMSIKLGENRHVILRWATVLAGGIILGFLLIFLPNVRRLFISLAGRGDLGPAGAATVFWLILYGCVGWLTIGFIGSRVAHLRHVVKRPPLVLAGLFAIGVSLLFKPLRLKGQLAGGSSLYMAAHHAFYYCAVVFGGSFLWEWLTKRVDEHCPSSFESGKSNLTKIDRLLAWIEQEKPIAGAEDDLLEFGSRVEPILDALYASRQQTIGIAGSHGSGKSSLVNLVEKAARECKKAPELWFCKVSCWGFSDAAAAQEAVLKQAIITLREKIDLWGLRTLPEDYAKAISASHAAANIFLSFARPVTEPAERLKRLSPILKDANARLVIIVEDVDRAGSGFNFSQIQALLNRFREVEGVCFIITADLRKIALDFSKLCDHQEDLLILSEPVVINLLDEFRSWALSQNPEDVDPTPRAPTIKADAASHWLASKDFPRGPLSRLLRTPRLLKGTLRRMRNTWGRLHGEVDFDELLLVSSLRVAAPTAFDFLQANVEDVRHVSPPSKPESSSSTQAGAYILNLVGEDNPTRLGRLTERWKEICKQGDFEQEPVEEIIRFVFPTAGAIFNKKLGQGSTNEQPASKSEPSNYWQRIVAEALQPVEYRDQVVLQFMKKVSAGEVSCRELASLIVTTPEAAERFGCFGEGFGQLQELATEVYSVIRQQHPRKASKFITGFSEISDLLHKKSAPFGNDSLVEWAEGQIKESLPFNIRFACDIHSVWIEENGAITLNDLRAMRRRLRGWFKQCFRESGAPSLCECFDEDSPTDLSHISQFCYGRPQFRPQRRIKVWGLMIPPLIAACEQCPNRMLPQVLLWLKQPIPSSARHGISYEFDQTKIDLFPAKDREKFLKAAVALKINQSIAPNERGLLEHAVSAARRMILDELISSIDELSSDISRSKNS